MNGSCKSTIVVLFGAVLRLLDVIETSFTEIQRYSTLIDSADIASTFVLPKREHCNIAYS